VLSGAKRFFGGGAEGNICMAEFKILAVDDEPNILLSLEFILEEENYTVRTASDGEEALAVAEEFKPDLVLLDVAMPRKDGYEVCRILKAKPDAPKVVMLTAKGQSLERKKGLETGADAYVTKPFQTAELFEAIRGLLGN
jgi:DNA-binding response OmpR family regulator